MFSGYMLRCLINIVLFYAAIKFFDEHIVYIME